jgi:hypothetical protein
VQLACTVAVFTRKSIGNGFVQGAHENSLLLRFG